MSAGKHPGVNVRLDVEVCSAHDGWNDRASKCLSAAFMDGMLVGALGKVAGTSNQDFPRTGRIGRGRNRNFRSFCRAANQRDLKFRGNLQSRRMTKKRRQHRPSGPTSPNHPNPPRLPNN
jgi:hypothetical protein